MNNEMCTNMSMSVESTQDGRQEDCSLCRDILICVCVCVLGQCEPGQREMFSVLCCTSIMEACCIMTAQTVGILSFSLFRLLD